MVDSRLLRDKKSVHSQTKLLPIHDHRQIFIIIFDNQGITSNYIIIPRKKTHSKNKTQRKSKHTHVFTHQGETTPNLFIALT